MGEYSPVSGHFSPDSSRASVFGKCSFFHFQCLSDAEVGGHDGHDARTEGGVSFDNPAGMSHHALPAVPTPLALGTRLGAYTLSACRAEDLDGFVYDAVETLSGRAVTIREGCPVGLVERTGASVTPLPGAEADFRDWLLRWARLLDHWQQATISADLARLAHPVLVRIEARGQAHGTTWVCLPPASGRSLRQVVEDGPGWPDRTVIDTGLHACCAAVESLHRLGEVHGNLTPERVWVLDSGEWCLPLPDTDPARQPLSPWLAPEQTEAGRAAGLTLGPWTDVHAIASLAHWLLTGAAPPSVSRRRADEPGCWTELERVEADPLRRRALRTALAPEPADRLGTVAALRMALGWSERPAPPVPEPKPAPVRLPPPPPPLAPRRDRFSPVALVGLLVAFGAVFGVLWLNRTAGPEVGPAVAERAGVPAVVASASAAVRTPAAPVARAASRPVVVAVSSSKAGSPVKAKVQPPAHPPAPSPAKPARTVADARPPTRAQSSEACVEWLRRRSLEPTGTSRVEPNPACR